MQSLFADYSYDDDFDDEEKVLNMIWDHGVALMRVALNRRAVAAEVPLLPPPLVHGLHLDRIQVMRSPAVSHTSPWISITAYHFSV